MENAIEKLSNGIAKAMTQLSTLREETSGMVELLQKELRYMVRMPTEGDKEYEV